MKRWFLTLILGPRLKKLRKPLDPTFAAALKNKLECEAQHTLSEDRVSFIPYEWKLMKKNSFVYVSALLLVAITGYLFFPYGKTLTAEDVIQKASAAYGENANGSKIYHEQVLIERYENDAVTEASLEESWINAKSGETLFTYRNPDNNDLVKASGSNNQGDDYEYPAPESPGMDMDQTQKTWSEKFVGDKYVCEVSEEKNGEVAEGVLQIAADDPSIHTTTGQSYALGDEPKGTAEESLDATGLGMIQKIMESDLADTDTPHTYSTVRENGKEYYVFNEKLSESQGLEDYFDAKTFHLVKTIVRGDNPEDATQADAPKNSHTVYNYLTVEYLDESESASIFDFSTLGMTLSLEMSAGIPAFGHEDGCYDPSHQLMNADDTQKLLDQVGTETVDEWKNYPEMIFENEAERQANFTQSGAEKKDTSGISWIKPTDGIITQGFQAGHYGIDISDSGESPPIVAVADGIVVDVGEGWNGGYGNKVSIDHGNGYTSTYAHLNEVDVKVGDSVKEGQMIGIMGNTGRVFGKTGIFLHFELSYNDTKINPIATIKF